MTTCGLPITPGEVTLGTGGSQIVFSCDTGFVLTELQVGFPGRREVVRNRAIGNGTIDQSQYFSNRALTLSVTLDTSLHPTQTLLDRLLPLMATGNNVLAWRLGDTPLLPGPIDKRWRSIRVRGQDAPVVIIGPRYTTIVCSFVSSSAVGPSHILVSPTATTVTLAQNAAAQIITNYGTASVPWFIRFDGPLSAVGMTINGLSVAFDPSFALLAGESVTLDSFARRVTSTKPGFPNPYDLLNTTDWTWDELWFAPGSNSVVFPPVTGAGTMFVSYRDGWW